MRLRRPSALGLGLAVAPILLSSAAASSSSSSSSLPFSRPTPCCGFVAPRHPPSCADASSHGTGSTNAAVDDGTDRRAIETYCDSIGPLHQINSKRCQSSRIYAIKSPKDLPSFVDPSSSSSSSDDEDEGKEGGKVDHSMGDGAISSSSSSTQTTPSSSSTTFQDEECYDLCEVTNDDLLLVPSAEEEQQNGADPAETATTAEAATATTGADLNSPQNATSPPPPPAVAAATDAMRRRLDLHWSVDRTMTETSGECDLESNDMSSCGADQCETCRGTGRMLCRFCGGTTFLTTVGGKLLFAPPPSPRDHRQNDAFTTKREKESSGDGDNSGGGTVVGSWGAGTGHGQCPLCDADGEVECDGCRGSGWVAGWRR